MRRKHNKIPKLHVRKGDMVFVRSGDDKGKTGLIKSVNIAKQTAIVEEINLVTQHKKRSDGYPNGARITVEAPIHVSKLQLLDPKSGKPTRIGRKKTDQGWVRYSKKSGELIRNE